MNDHRPEGDGNGARPGPALLAFGVAVSAMHHIGALPGGLGEVGPLRWADLLDLLTPYVVLAPAVAVLARPGAGRRPWLLGFVGGTVYTSGHGLHLSANSVSNTAPVGRTADAVHLWDEVLGHVVWYAGLAMLVAALVLAMAGHADLRIPAPGWVAALAVGLTHATNGLEGGTALGSLAVAVGFAAWGRALGGQVGRLLLVTYLPAAGLLVAYGLLYGGYPQPSELR